MPKTYKILVSTYACSPNRGSEPGMGWNFVLGLSRFHEVHVIVEKRKWETAITSYINSHPELKENLKFYFIEKQRNKWLRKIWPPSYYWFYEKWQKKAYQLALTLDQKENFDLIHQLNMVGYREPGYLWKINKPFVWGPIGGLENSPWSFLPSLGYKGCLFYMGRNLFNLWQRTFFKRPQRAAKKTNSVLIAATPNTKLLIRNLWGVDSVVINEVGQYYGLVNTMPRSRLNNEPLSVVWSGLHTPRKNLPLLMRALGQIKAPYHLHILGAGEMTGKWKALANELGIMQHSTWYGWLPQEEAITVMGNGHVFVITSISDLTSTVTLEALSHGLPIICLDHCGFADVVNVQCGIKVVPSTPKKACRYIADALETLYHNESLRTKLSKGALSRAQDYSWPNKITAVNNIYNRLVNGSYGD